MMRLYSDRVLVGKELRPAYVGIENGQIVRVSATPFEAEQTVDCSGSIVAPGFVELHCHGGMGADYGKSSPAEMKKALDFHLQHGATTQLPTVTTAPIGEMEAALERLSQVEHPAMAGVHLEGPYLSLKQSGAQDPATITAPVKEDYERLISRFGSLIRRWSYAPERDEGNTFLSALVAAGIVPAAGHTDALYEEMDRAAAAGCRLVTHLYSCTSTVVRIHCFRHGGVLETALLRDDMDVELIADGCHLPPELLRLVWKVKGAEHIALITDALAVAGLKETETSVGPLKCIVEDGVCKLADRSAFAGSIATADRLVRTAVAAGIPLADALIMASATPARILGLPKGQIREDWDADLVILNKDLSVQQVYLAGKEIL